MSNEIINQAIVAEFISETMERFSEENLEYLVGPAVKTHPWAALLDDPARIGFAEVNTALRAAFGDVLVTVPAVTAEGDSVFSRFVCEASHIGAFAGTAATGRRIRFSGILRAQLSEGRIVAIDCQVDRVGLLIQIGAREASVLEAV